MKALAQLVWEDGRLQASAPHLPALTWARPAELAEARLNCESPLAELALDSGADLLTAAFTVIPFVRDPLPAPTFGAAVTPAAQAAFMLFLGTNVARTADAFRVLRGEPDDFLVCARRYHDVWKVGAFTVAPTTLTVRFEDLWNLIPAPRRFRNYLVEVHRDPTAADGPQAAARRLVDETLTDIAPDARICLDLAANGGFTLTFWPIVEDAKP